MISFCCSFSSFLVLLHSLALCFVPHNPRIVTLSQRRQTSPQHNQQHRFVFLCRLSPWPFRPYRLFSPSPHPAVRESPPSNCTSVSLFICWTNMFVHQMKQQEAEEPGDQSNAGVRSSANHLPPSGTKFFRSLSSSESSLRSFVFQNLLIFFFFLLF